LEMQLCALTFELRGERRCGAWPARRMMDHNASRAKCHAGARPLERRVRAHLEAAQATEVQPVLAWWTMPRRLRLIGRNATRGERGERGGCVGRPEWMKGRTVPGSQARSALVHPTTQTARSALD